MNVNLEFRLAGFSTNDSNPREECYKSVKEEVLERKMSTWSVPNLQQNGPTIISQTGSGLSKYMSKPKSLSIPTTRDDAKKLFEEEIASEFEEFLAFKFPEIAVNDYLDPLLWWNTYKSKFPLLCETAFAYLSIPACSVGPERRFSAIGRVTQGRYSLHPSTISALVTLKDWYGDYPHGPWNTQKK